jgi:hypothetical protein
MGRRYASDTSVSVSKSRGEIENVLRVWGAKQMQWSDDFDGGRAMLRFIWEREGVTYTARFTIGVPTKEDIREESLDGRTGRFSQSKYDKAMSRRGMVEHRELALLLKAIFVAVDCGLISAEQVFLPFLEDQYGVTVSDRVLPGLAQMLKKGGTKNLLPMFAGEGA